VIVMPLRRAHALIGAAAAAAFAACSDVPFTPKWDADMYMPLSTRSIALADSFPGGVMPGSSSLSVDFPALEQDVSGVLGELLRNLVTDPARCASSTNPSLSCDRLVLTVTKRTPVAGDDTLFVANSQANLNASGPGTIVFPINLLASDLSKTDSIFLTHQSVAMLQTAAEDEVSLWVQLRGRVSNPSASAVSITGADSLGLALSATVRVAVSHR
jgi:hypothetical protein